MVEEKVVNETIPEVKVCSGNMPRFLYTDTLWLYI